MLNKSNAEPLHGSTSAQQILVWRKSTQYEYDRVVQVAEVAYLKRCI